MSDYVEQPADTPDSDDAGSASGARDLGKSDYIEPQGQKLNLDMADFPDDTEDQDGAEELDDEIEVGDRKVPLPKSVAEQLRKERMLQADYTQKTQTVAEERRQMVADREQFQRQQQEHQQYIADYAKVVALNDQLAAFEAADWNALILSDPVQAMQLQQQQRALEAQRNDAAQKLTQKQQQFALDQQQETAKAVQEAKDYFTREIPGWSPQVDAQLKAYVLGHGLKAEVIAPTAIKAPAMVKLFHKAMLYDALVKKQQASRQQQNPAPEAKPVARVGSSAPVKKDPTKMTDAEFAAYRRAASKRK